MDIESIKELCISFPHVTEDVKWGNDLCYSVGGKLFCITAAKDDKGNAAHITFKCTPEKFAELTQVDGIVPAPHGAQLNWVAVQESSVLDDDDYEDLITKSYMLVREKLPDDVKRML